MARVYTRTRDEDLHPEMHARRSEPVCYVSSEGLVLLPKDVRQQLKVEQGGDVGFIPNKETGRFEIWTTDQIEQWLSGDDADADDA
jgi:bifunctional DNA-binding transcriptional regulator/antitoxin component of YhaV-PrlF toxin-antitoxin module